MLLNWLHFGNKGSKLTENIWEEKYPTQPTAVKKQNKNPRVF